MYKFFTVPVLIYGLMFWVWACDDQSSSEGKIINGQRTDAYPEVQIVRSGGMCTGTFVSKTTMITAAHCVMNGQAQVNNIGAQAVFRHPRYSTRNNNGVNGIDLAVVVWNRPISTAFARLHSRAPEPRQQFTIVGFGGTSTNRNRATFGVKHFGNNAISRIRGGMIEFSAIEGDQSTGAASFSGDSGGPLFIDGRLAGVTSGGGTSQGRKISLYVDLYSDSSREFLRSTVERGADIRGLDGQGGVDDDLYEEWTVPEPKGRAINCNDDFNFIRQIRATGVCYHADVQKCFNFDGGSVRMEHGAVPCPDQKDNNGTSLPGQEVDCNDDFAFIRSGAMGICKNSSTEECFGFSNGGVRYGDGAVSCGGP